MEAFSKSFLLLFVLLNPFSMSVYLLDLVRTLGCSQFARQLTRAALISLCVFLLFAWAGDAIFEDVLQVRFLSFLMFGGIVFLLIGIRLILGLGSVIPSVQSHSKEVSASIAIPFMVGPGTISACVLAGNRLDPISASLAIGLALTLSVVTIVLFKQIHDYVHSRNELFVHRYTEIAGRVTALFIGSFAIEMILTALEQWLSLLENSG